MWVHFAKKEGEGRGKKRLKQSIVEGAAVIGKRKDIKEEGGRALVPGKGTGGEKEKKKKRTDLRLGGKVSSLSWQKVGLERGGGGVEAFLIKKRFKILKRVGKRRECVPY